MTEIEKLRFRIKNIPKNATEYRMTVNEVRDLLAEIDEISKQKQKQKPPEVVVNEPTVINRTIDGGAF